MKRQDLIDDCIAATVVAIYFLVMLFVPTDASQPVKYYQAVLVFDDIIVALALMVVSSLITAALTPKPKPPQPGKADKPEILEGKAPVTIYGAVWIKDPFMAAWSQLEPAEPIKAKGGK